MGVFWKGYYKWINAKMNPLHHNWPQLSHFIVCLSFAGRPNCSHGHCIQRPNQEIYKNHQNSSGSTERWLGPSAFERWPNEIRQLIREHPFNRIRIFPTRYSTRERDMQCECNRPESRLNWSRIPSGLLFTWSRIHCWGWCWVRNRNHRIVSIHSFWSLFAEVWLFYFKSHCQRHSSVIGLLFWSSRAVQIAKWLRKLTSQRRFSGQI